MERLVSIKISDTPFLKTTPLFYQPLPFYGKKLNPAFWENFESLNPHFIK